jgi:hypothetical protein
LHPLYFFHAALTATRRVALRLCTEKALCYHASSFRALILDFCTAGENPM